jgi:hypothetical protein
MNLKFDEGLNLHLSIDEHLVRDYKEYDYASLGKVEYSIVCLDPDIFL